MWKLYVRACFGGNNIAATKVLYQGVEPYMNHKMYNGRVLCAWLASCAADLVQHNPTEENVLMCGCLP